MTITQPSRMHASDSWRSLSVSVSLGRWRMITFGAPGGVGGSDTGIFWQAKTRPGSVRRASEGSEVRMSISRGAKAAN